VHASSRGSAAYSLFSLGRADHGRAERFEGVRSTADAGTTVCLGANVDGASFSLGDGHYAPGPAKIHTGSPARALALAGARLRLVRDDPHKLASQVARTGVANVVDTTNTVLAKFRKCLPHRGQRRQRCACVRFR
jgi:hypothetical protein